MRGRKKKEDEKIGVNTRKGKRRGRKEEREGNKNG